MFCVGMLSVLIIDRLHLELLVIFWHCAFGRRSACRTRDWPLLKVTATTLTTIFSLWLWFLTMDFDFWMRPRYCQVEPVQKLLSWHADRCPHTHCNVAYRMKNIFSYALFKRKWSHSQLKADLNLHVFSVSVNFVSGWFNLQWGLFCSGYFSVLDSVCRWNWNCCLS